MVLEKGFTTDAEGSAKLEFKLGPGVYRAMLETQDRFGKRVTARLPVRVLRPDDTKLAIKIPHLLAAPKWSFEPGEELMAVWGTGYDAGRAFIEFEHRNRLLRHVSFWISRPAILQHPHACLIPRIKHPFGAGVDPARRAWPSRVLSCSPTWTRPLGTGERL